MTLIEILQQLGPGKHKISWFASIKIRKDRDDFVVFYQGTALKYLLQGGYSIICERIDGRTVEQAIRRAYYRSIL